MANHDVKADPTPALQFKELGSQPSVSALRTAISGSAVSASYDSNRLDRSTKNDLVYVARIHNISVSGL